MPRLNLGFRHDEICTVSLSDTLSPISPVFAFSNQVHMHECLIIRLQVLRMLQRVDLACIVVKLIVCVFSFSGVVETNSHY